jgi:hypothetical protein
MAMNKRVAPVPRLLVVRSPIMKPSSRRPFVDVRLGTAVAPHDGSKNTAGRSHHDHRAARTSTHVHPQQCISSALNSISRLLASIAFCHIGSVFDAFPSFTPALGFTAFLA